MKMMRQRLEATLKQKRSKFFLLINHVDCLKEITVEISKEEAKKIYSKSPMLFLEIDCHRLPTALFSKKEREEIYKRYEENY